MNTENNITNASTQNFEEGTILHSISLNKYSGEVKESFSFEGKDTKEKFSIKKERLLEIANQLQESDDVRTLLNNGWKSNEKISAGSGKALKIILNGEYYECIFYIGKTGEKFDPMKIERKSYIKFTKEHLSALLTFLMCNDKVEKAKAEEERVKRTTLDLD